MQQTDYALAQATKLDAETIDVLDYLDVVVKHRRMIVYTTIAAVVISALVCLLLPRIYSSTTRILPPQQDNGMMGFMLNQMGGGGMASLAGDLLGKGGPADLYSKILETEAIKDAIIDRFDVIRKEKTEYREFAYTKLDKKVTIETGKKDGIISITVDDKDPKRAADMANAYVEELGKLVVRLNLAGVSNDRAYLEERLAKVKSDYNKASDALKAFQLRHKTLALPEQGLGTIRGVAALQGQLAAEEVKLAGLRRVFTDTSQDVKNQRTVIANLRSQIAKFEGSSQEGSMPGIGTVVGMEQDYMRLMREFKIQETLLDLLTKQYELAKLNEAKDDSSIQIIQKARVSDKSIKPSRRNIVMISTAGGLFMAVMMAFIMEMTQRMDPRQKERLLSSLRQLTCLRRDAR